jgi:DNA-damage-inducible protein D
MDATNKIVLFQEKAIRRIWHNESWFYSIVDVMAVLTDSSQPSRYWNDLKKKISKNEATNQVFDKIEKVKFLGLDGKSYPSDGANTKTLLRLIMSVPSPKAEPFKQWMAQVGEERIQEIENPEIAIERARDIYKAKGYSDEWIESRIKSIGIRKELTDEWSKRSVKEGQEYSILTAEIAKATFGLTPSEHKKLKSLDKQNLRDHMTNLELIFTMLGEEVTKQFAIEDDAVGFEENQDAARRGGKAAGEARRNIEKRGAKVVSPENFLNQIENAEKKNALSIDTTPDVTEG